MRPFVDDVCAGHYFRVIQVNHTATPSTPVLLNLTIDVIGESFSVAVRSCYLLFSPPLLSAAFLLQPITGTGNSTFGTYYLSARVHAWLFGNA